MERNESVIGYLIIYQGMMVSGLEQTNEENTKYAIIIE